MSDDAAFPGATAGPPSTPFERRRLRRRVLTAVGVVVVLLGVTLVLLVPGAWDDATPPAGPPDGSEAPPPADAGPPDDGRSPEPLERPDLADLDPADRELARVLIAIDESELTMLTYDEELTEAFGSVGEDADGGVPDLEGVLVLVSEAAGRGEAALATIAERLAEPSREGGAQEGARESAEAVRAAYLPHLEAWRVHMARVAATPDVLLSEDATEADTVEINVTADAFRRRLEEVLEGDVDPEVAAFAEAILDRGFRGYERDAEVAAPSPAPSPSPRAIARSAASSATSASRRSSS